MLVALMGAQAAIWALVVLASARALRLWARDALDGERLAEALRGRGESEIAELSARLPPRFAALTRLVDHADAREALVLLEEREAATRRSLEIAHATIRISGMIASALGFLTIASAIAWLHADHGLLDLDPVRVGQLASSRATIAFALALAGSGSALAAGRLVGRESRRALCGVRRVAERIEGSLEARAERRGSSGGDGDAGPLGDADGSLAELSQAAKV